MFTECFKSFLYIEFIWFCNYMFDNISLQLPPKTYPTEWGFDFWLCMRHPNCWPCFRWWTDYIHLVCDQLQCEKQWGYLKTNWSFVNKGILKYLNVPAFYSVFVEKFLLKNILLLREFILCFESSIVKCLMFKDFEFVEQVNSLNIIEMVWFSGQLIRYGDAMINSPV